MTIAITKEGSKCEVLVSGVANVTHPNLSDVKLVFNTTLNAIDVIVEDRKIGDNVPMANVTLAGIVITSYAIFKQQVPLLFPSTNSGNGGSGDSGTSVTGEEHTGSATSTITLAHAPDAGTLAQYKNGVRLPAVKFSVAGTTLTLTDARLTTDIFQSDYKYTG